MRTFLSVELPIEFENIYLVELNNGENISLVEFNVEFVCLREWTFEFKSVELFEPGCKIEHLS